MKCLNSNCIKNSYQYCTANLGSYVCKRRVYDETMLIARSIKNNRLKGEFCEF
jgi:hypothetical protein